MWRCLCVCTILLLIAQQGSAEVIIDSFTSGEFELTQEDMRQINTDSLSDVAVDLPDVASGRRFTGVGDFAQSIFTNPAANVRLAVGGGKLELESNYGAETFVISYGSKEFPLQLNLEDPPQQFLIVDFAYFRTNELPNLMQSLIIRVGGQDLDGQFRPNSSDPLYPAFAPRVQIPRASDDPFSVVVPLNDMTSLLNPVDLTSIDQLRLSMTVSPTGGELMSFAIDEIRIVPEPCSEIMLLVAACCVAVFKRRGVCTSHIE